MSFLAFLIVALLAAYVFSLLFTLNSNYLDHKINTSLDLTSSLKLQGQFTDKDRAENNRILRNKISVLQKMYIISEQMEKRSKTQT
uniref:Wsv321-like protein n=1 Tax=Sicyonia whispovirus TaxID=2984283 RepID=A0A9C7F0U9_9VIRU|nr:MAG: wsv321-like protein [Sicyonia whispovirus]